MNKEIWLPAEGYPGYEVSNLGHFRSFLSPKGVKTQPHPKSVVMNNGRAKVNVRINGKSTLVLFARVVARAFLGEPNGRVVVYKNEDPSDCRAENLEYVTIPELWDRVRLRRFERDGDQSPMGRHMEKERRRQLQLDRALEVKTLRDGGMTFRGIGDYLGISESGACRIYYGLNNKVLEKALAKNG